MKKFLALLLCMVFILGVFTSCNSETNPPENTPTDDSGEDSSHDTDSDVPDEPAIPNEPEYDELDPNFLAVAKQYTHDDGSVLSSYLGETVKTYEEICVFYEAEGYELYCENDFNGNLFSTYVKGDKLAHIYWIDVLEEINILTSETRGKNLPEKNIIAEGDIPLSVTQLQQETTQTSGMAYIIQLADGSFIIYDGAYAGTVRELCNTLTKLKGDKDIHIRAWLITHSHDDHCTGFEAFTTQQKRYLHSLTLDYVLISPIEKGQAVAMDGDANYFAGKIQQDVESIEGAKLCYVSTGMSFDFVNARMDILFTPDELFIDGTTWYFNDTSTISRISSNQEDSGDTMNMIFLGDAGVSVAERLMMYYGDFLRSDMCQISHHGVENFPLLAYRIIKSSILWYPCNTNLYSGGAGAGRDDNVRAALRDSSVTKEILLRDNARYKRYFNPELNPEFDSDNKFPSK